MRKTLGLMAVAIVLIFVAVVVGQTPTAPHFRRTTLANGDTTVEITKASAANAFPPGSIIAYAGGVVPEGWLLCDGSFVTINSASRSLLSAIQTNFGGDGQKNFRLPDLRGRAIIGLDDMGGASAHRIHEAWASRLGKDGYGGKDDVRLSLEQMPSHTHHATTGKDSGKHSHLIAYRC